jgi:3-hydroxyisobutyrate dehydrogenase
VLRHVLVGSAAASTLIRSDIGLVFRGDYLDSFGLDRICEELEAVTTLAGEYQVPWELSDVVRRTCRRALDRFAAAAQRPPDAADGIGTWPTSRMAS